MVIQGVKKLNLDKIKQKINSLKNKKLKVKVYIGRNKYEYYEGYIENTYNNIFTIKTTSGIKSFSYSDIAIKTLYLSEFK